MYVYGCMYVCVMYVCGCMYVCVMYVCGCMYVCVWCTLVLALVPFSYLCVYVSMDGCVCVFVCVCMYVHVCIYVYLYVYVLNTFAGPSERAERARIRARIRASRASERAYM
jgi:hypothetical protein